MEIGKHMKYFIILLLLALPCLTSAQASVTDDIRLVEKQFQDDLNEKGTAYAFEKYAATDAVIKRENDTLIFGRDGIRKYYARESYKNAKAYWSPDRIEVSGDGTMASTFGKYRWIVVNGDGKTSEFKGVFHTVWKRQSDGTWKYIWD